MTDTPVHGGLTRKEFLAKRAAEPVEEIERLRTEMHDLIVDNQGYEIEIERLHADKAELLAACKWLEPYARVQVERHPNNADSQNWQKLLDAIKNAEVHK